MDLTVVVITKNAEHTLHHTLASVQPLGATCLVVDDYSTDKTQTIASSFGCRVVLHHTYDLGAMRAFALSHVTTKWALFLDSDEVLTRAAQEEIQRALLSEEYVGYFIPLRNHLFGKPLLHGERHKKLILVQTKKARCTPALVHEVVTVDGKTGVLTNPINHFSYRSPTQILAKFFDYGIRQAKIYKLTNKHYGLREIICNPLHLFYARYITDGGYKDGIFSRLFLDGSFACMEFISYISIPFVKEDQRIAVDAGSFDPSGPVQSGIDRLLAGVWRGQDPHTVYLWFGFAAHVPIRLPSLFFSTVWLPLATLWNRCDVFLATAGTIPSLLRFSRIRKVLILHDFGFYTHPDKYHDPRRLQIQTNRSVRLADQIILFSQPIYDEFVQLFPQYAHKAQVIPAGANHLDLVHEKKPGTIDVDQPFYLYVGVVKPIKQIELILEAVGDRPLIIAGAVESAYGAALGLETHKNVQVISSFDDTQLKWLYTHAMALVYASRQEGFCYPVLEALTLGCPVVALDLPLFRLYQLSFPHLTLVATPQELTRSVQKLYSKKTVLPQKINRYTWERFTSSFSRLIADVQTEGMHVHKFGVIVTLYHTPLSERTRLTSEIDDLHLPGCTIYWIDNSTNGKGYAAGVNSGIIRGLRDGCTDFIALNPDISIKTVTKDAMVKAAEAFDVWGFGMKQGNSTYYGGVFDPWRLSGGLSTTKPQQTFASVDFVSGSFIGFSAKVIARIGLWDESYFMYYEDDDYCMRARRSGLRVGIYTGAVYHHFESSTHNGLKEQWLAKSRWRFFWKYAGLLQKVRELIRLPKTLIRL